MIDGPTGGEPRHLFVVGLMRSGTSVLYRLLNNHPQICLLYESDILAMGPLVWPSWRDHVWAERIDFWNRVLFRHGLDPVKSALPDRVRGRAQAFRAVADAYYSRTKPGATYIGGKSIRYCHCLGAIAKRFPEARFVILWRPMAEIVDSVRRSGQTHRYFAGSYRRRQLLQQYRELVEGVVLLRRMGRAVHELSYQELVSGPEAASRELCSFLDLPWSVEMLAADPRKSDAIPDEEHHFHARYSPVGEAPAHSPELPMAWASKIQAYEEYWARYFEGQPARPVFRSQLAPGRPRRFFTLERWADSALYRCHLALRFGKEMVYRYAPLPWLRWYRRRFGRPLR
jgi:hypothetical protein